MNLKTIWAIWIVATVIVVAAVALGIYSSIQEGKWVKDIDSWRDAFEKGAGTSGDDNPLKAETFGSKITSGGYTGYISAAISLALVAFGHYTLYKAYASKTQPSFEVFVILSILTLAAFGFGIYGLFKDQYSDYVKSDLANTKILNGKYTGQTLHDAIRASRSSLNLQTFGYVALGLTAGKLITTIAPTIGIKNFKG